MRRGQRFPLLFVALPLGGLSLLGPACRPRVGGRCEKGEARCLDGARALICERGEFIEVPCRGAKGCAAGPKSIACDISDSRSGDRCSRDEEGTAACRTRASIVACHDGRFVESPCRGPKGCTLLAEHAICDSSIGVPGEACREAGKKACAADGSVVLECKEHALARLYPCRGARGCQLVEGRLDCDTTLAAEGDACDQRLEGHVACRPDRAAIVVCKNGRFAPDETCKKGTTCRIEGNQTRCTKS